MTYDYDMTSAREHTASVDRIVDEAFADELRTALFRIVRRMRLERSSEQITEGQYAVLAALSRLGPLTPGALAEREGVQPPVMTRTLNALAAAGLVERAPHPTDGRQVVVTITESGEEEIRETRRRRQSWMTARLADLTADEYDALVRTVGVLGRMARS